MLFYILLSIIQAKSNTAFQPRYNDEEKAFLKENFKDEFHFLQMYGLSIYKEEDRDEGKEILQGLMMGEMDEILDALISEVKS